MIPEKLPAKSLIILLLILCPGFFAVGPLAVAENGPAQDGKESAAGAGGSSTDALWQEVAQTGRETLAVVEDTFGSLPNLLTLAKRLGISLVVLFAGYMLWRCVKRYLLPRVRSAWPVKLFSGVILGFAVVTGILSAWGVDVYTLIGTPPGRSIFGSSATIVLVVLGAYILWEFVNYLLYKYLFAIDLGESMVKRIQTVLPPARIALFIVICIITLLVVLSELGINIAPMLAGAGILGLAIAFGSQALVKDLVTGFFVLLENVINVDDWVILGGHDGQVENLTLRHVAVRDIYGNLHTVPWSSVETITNQTRSFGYAVVEVGFAYRENVDEVVSVVQQVAAEMRQEPELNEGMLSDLQILGLIELGDSSVVVRTRFKTLPFMRWRLERDFRRRIKNRFDELGIEIPYPHQTIYFGENKQGTASPARVLLEKRSDPEAGAPGDESGS
ncbi:MAG: mechanosensitive ion channel [Desulfobacterales bacterium]|nr:mechanosensitive ion channel [Desulfobacterales bacterium]MBS3755287.1 mechanosensitive ion channel [Desulfobacterales bacterium]